MDCWGENFELSSIAGEDETLMCAGAGSEIFFPSTTGKGGSTLGKISQVLLMPMLKCGERKEERVGIGEMLSLCSLGCECSSSKCLTKPWDVLQYS